MKTIVSWVMGEEFVNRLETELDKIEGYDIQLIAPETKDKKTLKSLVKDADILLAGVADVDLLIEAKNLKFVQALTSSVARIDLNYLSKRNIPLCSGKGPDSIPVAEHTLMFMLMLARNASTTVSKSKWPDSKPVSTELYGKKVGILGAGYVGSEVAKLCSCIGMTVFGIDKYNARKKSYFKHVYHSNELFNVLPNIDFLTIHVPRTKETHNMISLRELKMMKPDSCLINVARGQVVNLDDLEYALKNRIIKGAASDVFPQEPPDYSHSIFKSPYFIHTPHIAGISKEARLRMVTYVGENIRNFVTGRPLINLIDPEVGF